MGFPLYRSVKRLRSYPLELPVLLLVWSHFLGAFGVSSAWNKNSRAVIEKVMLSPPFREKENFWGNFFPIVREFLEGAEHSMEELTEVIRFNTSIWTLVTEVF